MTSVAVTNTNALFVLNPASDLPQGKANSANVDWQLAGIWAQHGEELPELGYLHH